MPSVNTNFLASAVVSYRITSLLSITSTSGGSSGHGCGGGSSGCGGSGCGSSGLVWFGRFGLVGYKLSPALAVVTSCRQL